MESATKVPEYKQLEVMSDWQHAMCRIQVSSAEVPDQPRLRLVVNNEREERDSSGGYMSGRSSCRETPETSSTNSTRSAGTLPDLRHFWTAWWVTLQRRANWISPPPFTIARPTGPAALRAVDSFMDDSVQSIVAISQPPMRARVAGTVQFMVASPAKDEARELFSKNLNAELSAQEAPDRGRPDWLRRKLLSDGRLKVSRETCRKWLAGLDIPDQAHMSILISVFRLNLQKLRTGTWEPPPGAHDENFVRLVKAWPDLDDRSRALVMGIIDLARERPEEQPTRSGRRRA